MKKLLIIATLMSSFSVLAGDKCISDRKLDRKATKAKVLSTIGLGKKSCQSLKDALNNDLCEDVQQETINYAEEVLDYMCD